MPHIFEPTKNILYTCDLVDEGIQKFLQSLKDQQIGKFEFEVECLLNITHSLRIFESIVELARKDLVYIQSALILARSLLEVSLKVSWILHPPDLFECETRYVAHLNTEIEYLSKLVKEYEKRGIPPFQLEGILDPMEKFKNELSILLNNKGYKIPKLPNIREILKSLDEERKYINYMLLSQYTHLSHYAGKIYRKNLGIYKELSEEPQLDDWKFVFSICWPVFEFSAEFYLFRTQEKETLYSTEFKESIKKAFLAIE